jgi:hypothetical protein
MSKGLGAPQTCVRWADGASGRENRPIPLQHYKTRFLIGEPAERGQRHESVSTYHYQPMKAMPDAGKAEVSTISTYAVV